MVSPRRNPRRFDIGGRIVIRDVRPSVDCGMHPAKRIAGRPCRVEAAIFRDGHDALRASVRWTAPGAGEAVEVPMILANPGLDLWRAEVVPPEPGLHRFRIVAWTDAYATWVQDLAKRVRADQSVESEVGAGASLLRALAKVARGDDRRRLSDAADGLEKAAGDPREAIRVAADAPLGETAGRLQSGRHPASTDREYEIVVDPPRAEFGAWYAMFPRSQGTTPGKGATLREAERRLPDVARMGFDVLYLPPIHPIGRTARKGRNNSLNAGPGDPGSPWAIGSPDGGHDAVAPELGTIGDFDHFVRAASEHGLQIALDFALQCSPDHPWVREHPDWFYRRPDGSIRFAENPPKKYEDIYPLNFDTGDREGLWREIRRVIEFWIGRGVSIFRVDNPHTKPIDFWKWLIADVKGTHPETFFLAEAFTRPPMMGELARAGFSQSYSYFTWRNTKAELEEYLTELTQPEIRDYLRPNFFANTPDILPLVLARGGPPAFRMRLVLAGTLATSYGIYSGYELCERASIPHHAIPGDIEYADSEKFEIKVRDWDAAGHIKDFIARFNRIRRENPALRTMDDLRFLKSDVDPLLAYVRSTADGSNRLIVVVNLDPEKPREGMVDTPPEALGLPAGATYGVEDLLTGARYAWSARNYVRLDPAVQPAHILRVVSP